MDERRYHRIALRLVLAGLVLGPVALFALARRVGESGGIVPIDFTLAEQILITMTAFVVKPFYQVVSLVIVLMLWKRKDADLVALRRGMIAFFIGENACALNFIFFREESLLLEFLHTYGMVVCFGLVLYALMETLDRRTLLFSERERRCALLPQCGRCWKYVDMDCSLRNIFLFLIPVTAATAAIPLTAPIRQFLYAGEVFGSFQTFGHPFVTQILEVRIYPLLSLVFLVMSFILLLQLKEGGFGPSKVFYAMGAGLLGFSLMRFLFFWGYGENPLWADVWEELTEFLFVTALLWIVLRVRVVSRRTAEESSPS